MKPFRWNPIYNEAYRANAKRDRERGGSSVTVYATTAAMYAARGGGDACPFAAIMLTSRSGFADIREGFRFDLYGQQWEGF